MMRCALAALLLPIALPAQAQQMDHSHMHHGEMEQAPTMESTPPQTADDPHAGHVGAPATPQGTAPGLPSDHAADAFYDPDEMARARTAMIRENGGMAFSKLMLDRLEYRMGEGANTSHWEGEGWIGGDINRFAFKTEGEGEARGRLEHAEVQALYSRAIDPWFNLEAGVRHDFSPGQDRSYAVIGIDGLAPYWFEVSAQAFLSTKGEAHARLEASYDQRITQRLILQPAAEMNFAAQDVPELGIGSGLSDIELGLRLRYEFAREFAPYVGVNWQRKLGDTARFARADGDDASATALVMGVRFWF